jgi:DNA-binding transcriptional LysR family regulator
MLHHDSAMYIDSLKVFCSLAETGSFSRAGEANSISQSAVSQQISGLEKKLKVSLLERGGRRGVFLTPQGHVFAQICREILAIYDSIEQRLHVAQQMLEGEIRIASVYSIGLHDLPPILKQFRAQHPEVRVRVEYLRNAQIYSAVLSGQVDIGLVASPAKRKGVHLEIFGEDELVVICTPGHSLAKNPSLQLKDLDGQRFISFELDLPTRHAVDRVLKENQVSVFHYMEFDNIETVKKAVEVEEAVSLVPRNSVQKEVDQGIFVAKRIPSTPIRRQLGAICRRNILRHSAWKPFLDCLQTNYPKP